MKYLRQDQSNQSNKINVLQACFDDKSLKDFSPGLKMLYATDDLAIFIHLKKKDQLVVIDC